MITELCLVFFKQYFLFAGIKSLLALYLWNKFETLTGLRIIKIIYFYFPIRLNDEIELAFIFWNIWLVLTFGRFIFQLRSSHNSFSKIFVNKQIWTSSKDLYFWGQLNGELSEWRIMVYDVIFGELRFLKVTSLNYLNYTQNQI